MVYNIFTRLQLPRCLLCAEAADRYGLCAPCTGELPYLYSACRHCALPLPQGAHSCPQCQQLPPSFASARAAWHYAFPVGQLIQRFKYRSDLAAGHSLAQLAAAHIEPTYIEPTHIEQEYRPDLLVPIPLHWRRLLFGRGYNQAQLIAATWSHQWRIPLKARLLRKASAGHSQQQLKRAQRLRNLSDSFAVRGNVKDLHIGLVDDVITTGATLEAAARALLEAGAYKVSAFALARVP